ncbi:DUF6632 domain-containing protein [Microbulbifer spongiae]|uniref:DoxX family protein n=1 Tax=Microbulbifer spongiae TaxID=2944933 RepID=A0ABY9EFD3_9GAMM|nr:DUF6632 domain-containing protein [Microbulbifer sp. MI-G]WKD51718.1 hypothetical protein M8T91_18575 [Microbulbifer sp. MI-G]
MDDLTRVKYLRIALIIIGIFRIIGTYPMMSWARPLEWGWMSPYTEYKLVILSVYITLGIFLIRASNNLFANLGLIWFTIFLHFISATVLTILEVSGQSSQADLIGVISMQYLIAGVLWYLMPRNLKRLQQQLKIGSE